jgi:hypothetical protein
MGGRRSPQLLVARTPPRDVKTLFWDASSALSARWAHFSGRCDSSRVRSLSHVALSCQDDRPLYTERVLTGAVIDSLAASDVRAYLSSYGLQTSGTLVDVRRRLAVYVEQQHAIAASFMSEVPFNMPFNVRDALENAPDTVTSLAVGKGFPNAGNTCYFASALHFLTPLILTCVLNNVQRDAHRLLASAVDLVMNAAHGVSCTPLEMWNCLKQFPVGFRPAVDALRSSQEDAHEAMLHLLNAVSAFDDDLLSEYTSFTSQKILHCLSCDNVSQGACLATTNLILPVTRSVQHSLNSLQSGLVWARATPIQ